LATLAGILLIASHVWAQTPARTAQPPRPAQTAQPPATLPPPAVAAPVAPAAAPAAPAPPRPVREGQPINVRIELTITETGAGAPPVKKTVVAVVGDGYFGSVRGQAVAQTTTQGNPFDRLVAPLNLDARPEILPSGKIRLTCTIQYQSSQRMTQERQINTDIKQTLVLNLESGKPLVISEAADPVTDRNVIVEVKATILK
jgi:hypothetical protein